MSRLTVHGVAKAMYEAGLLTEWQYNNTSKIVIVLEAGSLPVVYFESLVDDKFLTVVIPELKGVEVIVNHSGTSEEGGGKLEGESSGGESSGGEEQLERDGT